MKFCIGNIDENLKLINQYTYQSIDEGGNHQTVLLRHLGRSRKCWNTRLEILSRYEYVKVPTVDCSVIYLPVKPLKRQKTGFIKFWVSGLGPTVYSLQSQCSEQRTKLCPNHQSSLFGIWHRTTYATEAKLILSVSAVTSWVKITVRYREILGYLECVPVADQTVVTGALICIMMNRTPRALLKGASSILAEGGSLTSNGVEYEASEAKDAIKGFVHIKDDKLKKDFQNSKIQNDEKGNINAPTGSSDDIKKPITAKEVVKAESKIPVTITKEKILHHNSSWSFFEVYLVVLNVLLSLGILSTIICIGLTLWLTDGQMSSFAPALIFASALNSVLETVTTVLSSLQETLSTISIPSYESILLLPQTFSESEFVSNFVPYALDLKDSFLESAAVLYDDSYTFLQSLFPN